MTARGASRIAYWEVSPSYLSLLLSFLVGILRVVLRVALGGGVIILV
jgi:hypothetical protein